MSVFVTGNMHYMRAPFVANIKPGHRVLILSDFSHDPRVWQIVQATCAELGAETTVALFERRPADYYDPPSRRVRSDDEVGLQRAARLDRHAAQPRELHRDGGRHPVDLHGRRHDAGMVPVRRGDRRHEADRGAQALRREARVRPERARVPRHLELRHRLQLQRGEPHHPAAAAGPRASIPTRSSTSPRTRTGRATTCSTICSRPANSTSRRSKAPPTASW